MKLPALLAIGVTLVTTALSAAELRTNVEAANTEALKEQVVSGDLELSTETYQAIRAEASSPLELNTTTLDYANALTRAGQLSTDQKEAYFHTARPLYEELIATGTPVERVVARNNFAAIAFKSGDNQLALEVLAEGVEEVRSQGDPKTTAGYLSNYGRVLMETGNAARAAAQYAQALELNPGDSSIADSGFEAAQTALDLQSALVFFDAALSRRRLGNSTDMLASLIATPAYQSGPDFLDVIIRLYRFLVTFRVEDPSKWLSQLPDQMSSDVQNHVRMITLAYGDALELIPVSHEARQRLTPWITDPFDSKRASGQLGDVSRFLAGVGDIFAQAGDFDRAIVLYVNAWALDTANLNALQYGLNLIVATENEGLLNRLLSSIFESKSAAYLGNDLLAMYGYHSMLGRVFFERNECGSSGHIRSATFQLERAIRTRSRIDDAGFERLPVPELYRMLGLCYEHDENKAIDTFLDGAVDSIRTGDPQSADGLLAEAICYEDSWSTQQRQRAASIHSPPFEQVCPR